MNIKMIMDNIPNHTPFQNEGDNNLCKKMIDNMPNSNPSNLGLANNFKGQNSLQVNNQMNYCNY